MSAKCINVNVNLCSKKWRRAQFSVDVAVCVRALRMCVRAHFRRVRGKLLTQRATVTPTIPSVLYARLVWQALLTFKTFFLLSINIISDSHNCNSRYLYYNYD